MNIAATIASFSTVKKLILAVFSLILFYFAIQLIRYHYLVVTFPYPLERFEGGMLLTTKLLLNGENPYALEKMPIALNPYGIIYHLFVYPFAKLWGSTFLVHRAVAGVFLLLSCACFFVILRRHRVNVIYSLSAVLVLYASLLYRYTPIAKPDGPGVFLFLVSIFIVYLMQYSTCSLVISMILGIMAFYTKPYFVLSVPMLAIYLFLFVSKKKAVFYGTLSVLLLAITALIVNQIYETYFVNTFFNHINVATNDLEHLQKQLEFFVMYYSGIILIMFVYFSLFIFDLVKSGSLPSLKFAMIRHELLKRIDIRHFDQPLIHAVFPLALYCFIVSSAIFYFWLGRHYGNIMTYAYHLVSPFFLIAAYSLLDLPLQNPHLVKRRENYNYILLLPCIVISLYFLYSAAAYLKNSPEWTDIENWQRVERITESHKNILNSEVLVSLLLEQDKPIYDTGLTNLLRQSHYPFAWLEEFLISNAEISKQWTNYETAIDLAIREKKFDAVIIASHEHQYHLRNLPEYYFMVDTIGVCMFQTGQCNLLEIWEPKVVTPID